MNIRHVFACTVFTWLNSVAFISLVPKSMWQLFKTDHYLVFKDNVYTHYVEIDCGTDQV